MQAGTLFSENSRTLCGDAIIARVMIQAKKSELLLTSEELHF